MEQCLEASPLGPRAEGYLGRRGLLEVATDPASGVRLGEVSATPPARLAKYAGRLVVPSFSARGTVTHITFRCMEDHDCGELEHGKYMHWPGLDSRLYHVESVKTDEPVIHLCEGQLDAATLVACGLPAVGIPGSQAWKPHAHRLFQGFERVVFWADQDDKGASMTLFEKIRQGVPGVELMNLPAGYDVNSYFVEHGKAGILALVAESYDGTTEVTDLDDEGELDDGDDWEPPELDEPEVGEDPGAGVGFGPAGTVRYDDDGSVIPF